MGTPLFSASNFIYCFVKNMRLLAASLEDPIFRVHPVFEELFASKMDASRLQHAITLSMEEPRDWGRCVVPDTHPILQGCTILHLVAGQPPKRGYEPANYEVWLDVICDEVFFSNDSEGVVCRFLHDLGVGLMISECGFENGVCCGLVLGRSLVGFERL